MKQPTSLVAQHPQVEGSDDEIVIWDDDFDNDDFSSSSRPHRLYSVASLLTNPAGTLRVFMLGCGRVEVSMSTMEAKRR